MPYHTFAYRTASDSTTADTDTNLLADGVTPVNNNHYYPLEDRIILGGWAGATDIARIRLSAPSLIQIGQQFVRPVYLAVSPPTNANLYIPPYGVLRTRAAEELRCLHTGTAGLAALVCVLCTTVAPGAQPYLPPSLAGSVGAFGVPTAGLTPVPPGPIYWLRGTGTTTLTAGAWTSVTMTWDVQLPAGVYSVGMAEFQGATCIAGRLTFPMQYDRPGMIGIPNVSSRVDNRLYDMRWGEWGRFSTQVLPLVEYLSSSADTTQEVYLRCAKIA